MFSNLEKETILFLDVFKSRKWIVSFYRFENIYKNHPEKTDAKKYAGYVSLITKQYDKALQQFQSLADIEGLYSNPGLFLKAITLLQRNTADDATQAKEILKQVIQKNLEGKQEAEVWLTKM